MDYNEFRKMLKKLRIVMRCPNCGKPYYPEDITLRGYADQSYFFSMDCSNCHTPVLANIVVNKDQAYDAETVAEAFRNLQDNSIFESGVTSPVTPIENSEILNLHKFMKNFDGDFSKLFDD
jgi:NAD-dependent SIR2 family protein deacetylase